MTDTSVGSAASQVVDGSHAHGVRAGEPGTHPAFDELVRVIWRLRQPDGCPWDRAQTHASIATNMIEEAYEAVDAIEGSSSRHLAEELGDVLMQVVLHAQIADDEGAFTIDDVCRSIADKLVRRHPHVFGDAQAATPEDVRAIWSQVKLAEHRAETDGADGPSAVTGISAPASHATPSGLLDGVPAQLPALMACQKISRKAAAAGFEWADIDGVWEQVASEVREFRQAAPGSDDAQMEFGDILFALVNVARWEGIDAEGALRASNAKFRRRWAYMEARARESGRDVSDLSNSEQEALWAEAKAKEKEQ